MARPGTDDPTRTSATERVLEEVVAPANLRTAAERVIENGGACGVDGMTVGDLKRDVDAVLARIAGALCAEEYRPSPVRRVPIPKPDGGVRNLGIPTVEDRVVQQALLQVLQPRWDPTFAEESYGFRPGRSAIQAVERAQRYIVEDQCTWVVDLDLEKFFDRVNHDVLMSRVARRTTDKRVLKLIRAFLNAGVLAEGLVSPTTEGTPQGGPLSPLLSNVLLDELDRELQKRGLRFARYADDCNIYVASERAGLRVKEGVTRFLARRLRLKVNEAKSAVARPWERKFLGFTFGRIATKAPRLVAPQAVARLKEKVRRLTDRNGGGSVTQMVAALCRYLPGWMGYFRHVDVRKQFALLDAWIRTRLRAAAWAAWETPHNRHRQLRRRGVSDKLAWAAAYSRKGPWRMAHVKACCIAMSNVRLRQAGVPSLLEMFNQFVHHRRV